MKKKVIVSTDCALDCLFHDPDDAAALLYLFTNQCLEIRAIVTSFGNTSESKAFDSIKYLLDVTGFTCRVIRGPKHERDGRCEAVDFLTSINQQEYIAVSTGPLTTFGQLSGRELRSFQDMYIMGGVLKGLGNKPPLYRAEFNIAKDELAARAVLNSRSVKLVPLDTTRKVTMTTRLIENVTRKWPVLGHKFARFNTINRFLRFGTGSHPHDLLLALAISNPELFAIQVTGISLRNGRTMKDTGSRPSHDVFFVTDASPIVRFLEAWSERIL